MVLSDDHAPPTIPVESPVATTRAWFAAVDAHDMPLALAHFAPARRILMHWSSWGTPFTHLRCSLWRASSRYAEVLCRFAPIFDPATGMSGDDYWTVSLVRAPAGPWLITNYGQG